MAVVHGIHFALCVISGVLPTWLLSMVYHNYKQLRNAVILQTQHPKELPKLKLGRYAKYQLLQTTHAHTHTHTLEHSDSSILTLTT